MSRPGDDREDTGPERGASEAASPSTESSGDAERRTILEVGAIYLLALALILAVTFGASAVPFISQNLYAFVAAIFVGLPYYWLSRNDWDFERFGLTWDGWQRSAKWGIAFAAITLVPFAAGYWVWATQFQNQEMHISADNYYQWGYETEGRPDGWGEEPGAWFWTDNRRAHLGLRAGDDALQVRLSGDRAFTIDTVGRVSTTEPRNTPHKVWHVELTKPQSRGQVIIGRDPDAPRPRNITVEIESPDGLQVRAGSMGTAHGEKLQTQSGLIWVLLWVATQLMFIALPEEFFYRGYIQTRVRDALHARRQRRERDADEDPSIWGCTLPNLITSILFAAGHLFVPVGGALLATRASVFFPSLLFGWLRDRNGHIAGAVVYHAASNLMVLMTAPHFM